MWRTGLEAVPVGPMGHKLTDWAIARHNFIVAQSQHDEMTEEDLEVLQAQENQVRHLLAQAGEVGALNEVLQQALTELHQRKGQLQTLSQADAQAIEQHNWTPQEGHLPEEFDIIVGRGPGRKRFVSLGQDQWANIPLESTAEFLDELRKKVLGDEATQQLQSDEEGDYEAALMHAIHCLLEAFSSHLSRFAMGVGEQKETPHWSVSQEPLGEHHGRPTTHEFVGVIASGNVTPSQFMDDVFLDLMAQRCDADKRDIRLVGALQMSEAVRLIYSPQAMRDLSWCVGKRLADGLDPLDFRDPTFQEARRGLGLSASEHFQDQDDHTLLLFSVTRFPSEHQELFGTAATQEQEDIGLDEEWIERISHWTESNGMVGTYVLPPVAPLEAVARLGAVHVAAMGQGEELAIAAGLGREGALDLFEPIDVVGFDDDNVPMCRTQLPAWMFGLLEEALSSELHELFHVRLEVLPHDHGLDLNRIPDINDNDDPDLAPAPIPAKRTLH